MSEPVSPDVPSGTPGHDQNDGSGVVATAPGFDCDWLDGPGFDPSTRGNAVLHVVAARFGATRLAA